MLIIFFSKKIVFQKKVYIFAAENFQFLWILISKIWTLVYPRLSKN